MTDPVMEKLFAASTKPRLKCHQGNAAFAQSSRRIDRSLGFSYPQLMSTAKPNYALDHSEPGMLSQAAGECISAVEGLHLTPRMQTFLAETKSLTGDERRKRILRMLAADQA